MMRHGLCLDMLMIDDKALMLSVKAGELDSLAQLFEKYHVALLNYFVRMGNSRSLGEDLVQETFVRVLNYRQTYQGENLFSSWLYRIARNTAIDYHRKPAQKQAHAHDSFEDSEHSDQRTLTEGLQESERQQHFEQALCSLQPEQRELIILSRYQQLKYEEIAELLGLKVNTLKTRMRAALSALKQQYDLLAGVSI